MIEANTRAFRLATLALCLGSAMIFANLHVVQSLLPTLALQFHLTELQASWSLTITILTLGLSLLVYGPLSDAIGRKPIMVVTMNPPGSLPGMRNLPSAPAMRPNTIQERMLIGAHAMKRRTAGQ